MQGEQYIDRLPYRELQPEKPAKVRRRAAGICSSAQCTSASFRAANSCCCCRSTGRLVQCMRQRFIAAQGFMTSDFSKRDEFSLTVRMEQQREIIKVGWGASWARVYAETSPPPPPPALLPLPWLRAAGTLAPPGPQHEARVQKAAEAKLAASRGGASPVASGSATEQQAGGGGSPGRKGDGPLLFDLVFEGEADLCIKVGAAGSLQVVGWRSRGGKLS